MVASANSSSEWLGSKRQLALYKCVHVWVGMGMSEWQGDDRRDVVKVIRKRAKGEERRREETRERGHTRQGTFHSLWHYCKGHKYGCLCQLKIGAVLKADHWST